MFGFRAANETLVHDPALANVLQRSSVPECCQLRSESWKEAIECTLLIVVAPGAFTIERLAAGAEVGAEVESVYRLCIKHSMEHIGDGVL